MTDRRLESKLAAISVLDAKLAAAQREVRVLARALELVAVPVEERPRPCDHTDEGCCPADMPEDCAECEVAWAWMLADAESEEVE